MRSALPLCRLGITSCIDREAYGTFEEYCKEKWNFNLSRARQLISAAEIADNIKSVTSGNEKLKERIVRPMMGLEPEQQREVYERAVERAPEGEVTAKHIDVIASCIISFRCYNCKSIFILPPGAFSQSIPSTMTDPEVCQYDEKNQCQEIF